MRINSTTNQLETYYNNKWWSIKALNLTATGGTITTSGGYTLHTYTSAGTSTFVVDGSGTVEILAVGAGGGSGAIVVGTFTVTTGTYNVYVGGGGGSGAGKTGLISAESSSGGKGVVIIHYLPVTPKFLSWFG